MGICYSQQQQWEAYKQSRKGRYRRIKHKKTSSVIYQQKSIYQSSFASNVYESFRDDLHHTISSLANENGGDIFIGSLVQMKEEELQILYKSLHKINSDGELHSLSDPVILCNLKTKNYLHTHKIKHPDCKLFNQISCCPYSSNHIPQYDIWKFIKAEQQPKPIQGEQREEKECLRQREENPENGDQVINVYIYHPFTQRFLAFERGVIVGSEQKMMWQVHSFGPRRNGGFIKVSACEGELCMSEQKGLLDKHRKTQLCKQKHISHIWQLNFVDPEAI